MGERVTPQKVKRFAVSAALNEAIDEHCTVHEIEFSDWIRSLAASDIGKPELADLPKGRPDYDATLARVKHCYVCKSPKFECEWDWAGTERVVVIHCKSRKCGLNYCVEKRVALAGEATPEAIESLREHEKTRQVGSLFIVRE